MSIFLFQNKVYCWRLSLNNTCARWKRKSLNFLPPKFRNWNSVAQQIFTIASSMKSRNRPRNLRMPEIARILIWCTAKNSETLAWRWKNWAISSLMRIGNTIKGRKKVFAFSSSAPNTDGSRLLQMSTTLPEKNNPPIPRPPPNVAGL